MTTLVMLRSWTLPFMLATTCLGCGFEYGEGKYPYTVTKLTQNAKRNIESARRDLLKIRDLKLGSGPVAAWGRKLSAKLEVRYANGDIAYAGPTFFFFGSPDPVGVSNYFYNTTYLSPSQIGIKIGLNGMKVGGERMLTIDSKLVCSGILGNPAECTLINLVHRPVRVRKETLHVKVTLTESCVPKTLRAFLISGGYLIDRQIGCRDSDTPQLDPKLPIWHVY